MKRPRPSIARLMAVVAVVAIDFAVGRLLVGRRLFADDFTMLIGLAPMMIVSQLSFVSLVRSRGPALMFWLGFFACGTVAMTSFALAVGFPSKHKVVIDPRTGTRVVSTTRTGWRASRLWEDYDVIVSDLIESVPPLSRTLQAISPDEGTLLGARRGALAPSPTLLRRTRRAGRVAHRESAEGPSGDRACRS